MPARIILYCLLALLISCQQAGDNGENGSSADGQSPALADDPIEAGLNSERHDEVLFALLFIDHFQLDGYREDVAKSASADPVAAMVMSSTYDDFSPAMRLVDSAAGEQDFMAVTEALFGAVYGLDCGHRVPGEFWVELSSKVPPAAAGFAAWQFAILDSSELKPPELSQEQRDQIAANIARAEGSLSQVTKAALYAFSGDAEYFLEWDEFFSETEPFILDRGRWAVVLRRASADEWMGIFGNVNETNRTEVLAAGLAVAPAELSFAANSTPWEGEGDRVLANALDYKFGLADSIDLSLLEGMVADDANYQDEPEGLYQLLEAFRHAVALGDRESIDYALGRYAGLREPAQNGILSILQDYGPDMASDSQLQALIDLGQRQAGYWLLFGWYDRPVVQESNIDVLVKLSPDFESVMLSRAYREWKEQEGIATEN